MANDNFFRIVADSQPAEKGWLSTLRCGHKVKRDIQEMPGFGVWCAECEVEGSKKGSKKEKGKKNVPQTERHTSQTETMVETPTTIHQETSSESGTSSNENGNQGPKKRELKKREKQAPANERMIKAKTENVAFLSKKDEFLAAVGDELKLLEDVNLGAAAFGLRCSNDTGLTLAYNPACVDNLTDDQLYGIVGHEIDKAGGWCILEAIKKGKKPVVETVLTTKGGN